MRTLSTLLVSYDYHRLIWWGREQSCSILFPSSHRGAVPSTKETTHQSSVRQPISLDNMYLSWRLKVIVAPFLSQSFIKEIFFRYIYQKINVQINIYVIELMTYYLTIKQGHGSHCDFSSCNYFIIHMNARMWAIFAPIILLLYLASFHLWRIKDIQVKRQQINSINI